MDSVHRRNVQYEKIITVATSTLGGDGPRAEFSPEDIDAALANAREWHDAYPEISLRTSWRPVYDDDSKEVLNRWCP